MSALQSSSGIAAEIAQSGLGTVATVVSVIALVAVVAIFVFLALAPHLSHPWTDGFGSVHAATDALESENSGALSAADD